MKTAFKFLAVLFAVFCFVFACEVTQQDKKPLTSTDEMFNMRDTLPAGGLMPQAIRVVPGRSWVRWISGDSILTNGFALMSQDSSNSKERIVTDEAVLAWLLGILPDSLNIKADTLTITAIGDSIAIQGSNSLQVPFRVYGVDALSDIYTKAFPSGSRIINRANGAQYLVQADSVSGYTTDSVAVIPTGGRFAVLQPQQGQYDITWFGAVGDGVTNNGDIPAKAASYIAGNATINLPKGKFIFDQTIEASPNGLKIKGVGSSNSTTDASYGSVLKYIGTGSAISASSGMGSSDSRSNRIYLESFVLIGTDSAEHAINFDMLTFGNGLQGDIISGVRIDDFSKAGSYGIYLTRTYEMIISNSKIWNCDNGIFLGTEAVNVTISDCWIRSPNLYGIHCTYGGQNTAINSIIDYSGTPNSTQRGIYNSGELNISGCHFEGNHVSIEATSAARMVISENKFNAADSINAIFTDGARIRLIGNRLPANAGISAGLGTEWIGGIEGNYAAPTITADNPAGFATITNVSGSFTLTTYQINAIPGGPFTLLFLNDSVTIAHSTAGQQILLKDGIPFKGYAGDRLILQKRENIGGLITIEEIARIRSEDNYMQNRSSNYTLSRGDHGLTFTNKGAADTVTFTLPSPGQFNDNMEYTFIKLDSDPMRIQTTGSPRKIRGGTATSYLELIDIGSSVTLRIDSLVYEIIHSNGLYRYSDPESGYAGGNLAGVSIGRIGDTLGLVSYELNRPLIGSGGTQHNTSAGIITNNSLTTNSKWLNINNTSDAQLYMGIGFEPNGFTGTIAHNPNVTAHLEEGRNTTGSALTLAGMRFDGTYASKTNLLNDTMGLVSINGYGWRGSSNRLAASIRISGAKNMGGTSYDGVIQFRTSSSGTFATRATIKRNGDFYLGDGLPEYDLSTPSAKIYIRSNSTTGSEYAMLVENSAGTDLFSIRNGGEVNVGNLTDIGNYILQITGDTYMDGSLTVTDSIILNGLSIISGTAAPASGLGSQGSLYMRDDDDSTLYTKTGTGWVLLN